MKYRELKEPCKSAIKNNKCLGCTGLAEENWREPVNCQYARTPSVQESLNQIWINLGVQEKIKEV